MIDAGGQLDRSALGRGVAAGVAVVGPAAGLSAALVDADDEGTGALGVVLFAVIVLGFAVGGAVPARRGVPLPFTPGAVTGVTTFAVVQAAVLVVSAAVGREGDVSITALLVNGLLASSAGMIGAMLASRRGRRHG